MPYQYKQLSGAQKRRKKNSQDAQLKCFKGTMERFVTLMPQSQSEGNPDVIERDVDVEQIPERTEELPFPEKTAEPSEKEKSDLSSVLGTSTSELISSNEEIATLSETIHQDFLLLSKDIGLWPIEIEDDFKEYFVRNKPDQNIDKIHFSKSVLFDKNRSLTESNFYRKRKNNELVKREWLVYSPSINAVFCYICKLFSSSNQALCKGGFSYWKNTSERLQEHENSVTHRNSVLNLSQRLSTASRIDFKMVQDYESECMYWRNVLKRVVATVQFLAQRGLPIYGRDETLHSVHNGNFLGFLELLGNFDSFIANHLAKYGNPGTGNVNYLSSTTVTEIIDIMGKKVLDIIVKEIKKAKYFGLILDSTADITHIDQLAVVVRYVNEAGEATERFIKFLHIHSHKASHLTNEVISLLKELDIDIKNCRGQSYDNASNMSGKYCGLQSQIKVLSPLAEYIPCSAHSLNLVGHNSVECCAKVVSFFGLVQNLYVFFSSSTHRWETLSTKLSGKLTLKALSSTRWSAAADATKCLRNNYQDIADALQIIIENDAEKPAVRHEARSLKKKFEKFETAILTVVWDTILQRLNSVNKTLQSTTSNISVLKHLFDSLIKFVQSVRDDFEQYEREASNLVQESYEQKRKTKIPKSKFLDDSKSSDADLTVQETFKYKCHYVICDALLSELNKRKAAYVEIEDKFGFLMRKCSEGQTKKDAKKFQALYDSDVDEELIDEITQFFHFFTNEQSAEDNLKMIRSQNIVHTFPNVDTALQLLVTLPISNCTSERSFSVLKRIKNRLRSKLKQDNLTSLSILSIESSITAKLDCEDVINTFISKKARKNPFVST